MPQRTEAQKISMADIKVRFGEKDYLIKPLGMAKAEIWKEQMGKCLEDFGTDMELLNPEQMLNVFIGSLLSMPGKMVELVFAYGPDLPREEILANATEEQFAVALSAIMQVAFPFFEILGTLKLIVKGAPSASSPQKASSLN